MPARQANLEKQILDKLITGNLNDKPIFPPFFS